MAADRSVLRPFDGCANCGAAFQTGVRYPVVARQTATGLEIHSFCDEDCEAAWRDAE